MAIARVRSGVESRKLKSKLSRPALLPDVPIGLVTSMTVRLRSQPTVSSIGFSGLMRSSRTTRSRTVRLSSCCDTARWRSAGSIELTPRRSSGDSVAAATPICATDL